MTCTNPIVAVSIGKNKAGKHQLAFYGSKEKFLKDHKLHNGSDNVFLLSCGQCDNCRQNYSYQWSIRCCLEACTHKFNYFVTLTYDNAHVDYANNKDFTRFIDRISYHCKGLKYFACKEFGEVTSRVHWHCILFSDTEIEFKEPVKIGDFYHFHSDLLSSMWTFGLHDITPFERDCAAYVAKYTNKDHQPVFLPKDRRIFMSRNLGYKYFDLNFIDIINHDFKVYGDFGNKKVIDLPKCFIRWYEEKTGLDLSDYKAAVSVSKRNKVVASMLNKHIFTEEDFLLNDNLVHSVKRKGVRNGVF